MAYFKSFSSGNLPPNLPFFLYPTIDNDGINALAVTYGEVDGIPPKEMLDAQGNNIDYLVYASDIGEWTVLLMTTFNGDTFRIEKSDIIFVNSSFVDSYTESDTIKYVVIGTAMVTQDPITGNYSYSVTLQARVGNVYTDRAVFISDQDGKQTLYMDYKSLVLIPDGNPTGGTPNFKTKLTVPPLDGGSDASWRQIYVCVDGVTKTMYVFGTVPK